MALAVVLLSGGLDSCVTAAVASQDFELALLHLNYGQRTVNRELAAFRAQAAYFQARQVLEADLPVLGQIGGSSLTDLRLPIPETEESGAGLPSTYVPFRNTIFIAVAVAWAEVLGAEAIFIGANRIDGPGYPDCRPDYFAAYRRLITLGTATQTRIDLRTPLLELNKADIVRLGLKLKAPLELTWSCYQAEDLACGRCASCRIRLQGFAAAGAVDPIPYRRQ